MIEQETFNPEHRSENQPLASLPENDQALFERLMEYGREMSIQPAEGRNFEVGVVYPNARTRQPADLILENADRHKIPISALLPEGFYLAFGEKYFVDGGERAVVVPVNEVETRGFFLSLFHEIGHAWDESDRAEDEGQMLKELQSRIVSYFNERNIPPESWKDEIERAELFPEWLREEHDSIRARSERTAHSIGLQLTRIFERQGFDVLAGFKKFQEVRDFIDWALSTYELERFGQRPTDESAQVYQTKFLRSLRRFVDTVLDKPAQAAG